VDAPYTKGHMEGYLWKRGKEDGKFQLRKFVLSESEGCLKYFVKEVLTNCVINNGIILMNINFFTYRLRRRQKHL